jgi:3-methyladenine DNA glycosylase/8-oxoguanine DNA glycosylase
MDIDLSGAEKEINRLDKVIVKQLAEIERLRAKLKRLEHAAGNHLEFLRAEIERLRAENKLLAHALFRIRKLTLRTEHLPTERVQTVHRIASEAVIDLDEPNLEGE